MVMAGWKFSHLEEIIQFGTDGKPLHVTAGQIGQRYPDLGLYLEERFYWIFLMVLEIRFITNV